MNEGPDFQSRPDDDDARDPLLGALRQRLGETFGQEPPPALWTSIRQQLPAAAPRPWWLRSRGLLALLALVGTVLLSGVAVWLTHTQPAARRLAHSPAARPARAGSGEPGTAPATGLASAHLPAAGSPSSVASPSASAPNVATTSGPRGTARRPAQPTPSPVADAAAPDAAAKLLPSTASTTRHANRDMHQAEFARQRRQSRHLAGKLTAAAAIGRQPTSASSVAPGLNQLADSLAMPSTTSAMATTGLAENKAAAKRTAADAPARTATSTARRSSRHAVAVKGRRQPDENINSATKTLATTRRHRRAAGQPATPKEEPGLKAGQVARARPTTIAAPAPPTAQDSLAARRAQLLLTAATALPAPLAARPDSAGPWLPPVRRWSVLALVGPTLSYRTIGQPFTTIPVYTTVPTNTNTANFSGRSGSSSNLVDLERPAAGLGAQVQVRRVLTGRWALAVGAGYQEYATRLALQVTSRQATSPANSSFSDSTFLVHQRDTYRFLTLPVQLSYALGPPRGRLSLGLLAGLEPSLYVGGRTTEGSTCSCQQQVFTSASGSPYSALTLGLSLGLEARYRLGGPASRWQWVLQPTGRYLATRLVRASSLGYTSRQPYSFGLFTGLAWEF